MMRIEEAKKLTEYLISCPYVYDWCICNRVDPSVGSVQLAIEIMPKNSRIHIELAKAVMKTLANAKQIRFHWLIKALALALDDDMYGNHITVELLERVKQLKTNI